MFRFVQRLPLTVKLATVCSKTVTLVNSFYTQQTFNKLKKTCTFITFTLYTSSFPKYVQYSQYIYVKRIFKVNKYFVLLVLTKKCIYKVGWL